MADHRHRRPTGDGVVLWLNRPPERGPHAEGAEEIAGYELHGAKSQFTENDRPCLTEIGPACDIGECSRVVTHRQIRRIRHRSERVDAINDGTSHDVWPHHEWVPRGGPSDEAQVLWSRDGQRSPKDCLHLRYECGAGADSQAYGGDCYCSESGCARPETDG
jgi:hypothetical protein